MGPRLEDPDRGASLIARLVAPASASHDPPGIVTIMRPAAFTWPDSFERTPAEEWTRQPLETLALKYDTVENHGWYRNLDRTVAQLDGYLADDTVLVDYSGGTGILADRLLERMGSRRVGIVIVDSSPKFLRLALDKFRHDERLAFRLLRYLKADKRMQLVEEVLEAPMRDRGVDALVSTNAIHLYYDLPDTLASWTRILRPGGRVFVQSGNIRNPGARPGEWIIDETVEAIHAEAMRIVHSDARYAAYRAVLDDPARMRSHDELRAKYFLPVRPLDHYLSALRGAGLEIQEATTATIEARVDEWCRFLSVYHEGVLGWLGGVGKVEGVAPSDAAVSDRLAVMQQAMQRLFEGRQSFECCWTYVTAARR